MLDFKHKIIKTMIDIKKLRYFVRKNEGFFVDIIKNSRYIWAINPETDQSYCVYEDGNLEECTYKLRSNLEQSLFYVESGYWIEVVL